MSEIKKYECSICKGFVENKLKGRKRFISTRKEVRKHLKENHNVKGRKNFRGLNKKEFGQSSVTKKTISYPFNENEEI